MTRTLRRFLLTLAAGLAGMASGWTADATVLRDALVLEPGGRAGRNTITVDAVEAQVVAGAWNPPAAGDTLTGLNGKTRTWTSAVADGEGWFGGAALRGGHALFRYAVESPRVVLLNAAGHSMAYVNGEPRVGDVYNYGYVQVPVLLQPGTNEFLFPVSRGRLRVQLLEPRAACQFNSGDPTTPDLIVGRKVSSWVGIIVLNATTNWVSDLEVRAVVNGHAARTLVGPIPPLGLRKAGVRLTGPAPRVEGRTNLALTLGRAGRREVLDTATIELRVRAPGQPYKETFVSGIDGSVQYFAVNPGIPEAGGAPPALFLSLHGASVEAIGQAESYGRKRWGTIVCPTNRRPYGFDWEDWGRQDALEVLGIAQREFRPDPDRIYLTGHSMGGHGTWSVGATFPDRFAAVGPSAGWISFFSYAGSDAFTNATPVQRMLRRAAASSDTLALATNYLHQGVYVVHGDADDNVPVTEARRMREVLAGFHHDVDGHEQPGAGHWWGNSDEPGTACVDWPPMFDFFARHRIPQADEVRRIRFVTVNPGVSARSHWLVVEAQERALEPSSVDIQRDPGLRRFVATTSNAGRIAIETRGFGPATNDYAVVLDGQKWSGLHPADDAARTLRFARGADGWQPVGAVSATHKNPARNGPFKDAFRNRMLFVYGTHGTPEENAWALAKARFDAESFWYRGNGSPEVMPDSAFQARTTADRGVILYGHAEMNGAWPALLGRSPVQVRRGVVEVGGRTVQRGDLGCLFVQPRPDSDVACVGVVAGSGMAGLRATQRLPYFMAGPGFPDLLVVGADAWSRGTEAIVAAGFFGEDWSVERGEWAWGE